MKDLFDVTVKNLKSEMNHISEQTDINFDVIDARFRELQKSTKKDKEHIIFQKIDSIEKVIENLVLEQGQLNSMVGSQFH